MEGPLSAVFEIKPALLAGRRTYEIGDGSLLCRTSDGEEEWWVNLTDIDQAAFVKHTIRGHHMWRIDLIEHGQRQSISLTVPARGAASDPEMQSFVALSAALSEALEQAQPGFQVGIGEYGKYRWIWFVKSLLVPVAAHA